MSDSVEAILGRAERALATFAAALRQGDGDDARAREAQALAAAAVVAELAGDAAGAARHREEGAAALDRAALARAPAERAALRAEPRFAPLLPSRGAAGAEADGAPPLDARTRHLLDILKRLAGETDLERLLARITDAAVELAGAEGGFVLLTDGRGELVSAAEAGAPHGPHDFSRSIAETVLIDGEPVVAVDARQDSRFREYRSVHQLSLRSVVALPIRGRRGPVGVLYLEHRGHPGRFRDRDLAVLGAFADQAAIAVENARLAGAAEARRVELERLNEALEEAHARTVRVLDARTEELDAARAALEQTREALEGRFERFGLVGKAEGMRRVFALVERVADVTVPVVVEGESGTGKELVARAIHDAGPRAAGPFVALNCGAIPETLLESELFGHVRGAFTGADRDRQGVFVRAHGGTLFLDEIADMSAKMQVDLLRVLQDARIRPVGGDRDQEVDVRIVAATQRPLDALVARGRFREDLYYRLHVVRIPIPPLRDRLEDLPLLCEHLLRRIAAREGGRPRRLTPEALARLRAHRFPGNVRELEHLLLGAHVLADGPAIDAAHLPLDGTPLPLPRAAAPRPGAEDTARGEPPPDAEADAEGAPVGSLDEYKARERTRILEALEASGWNRLRAAKTLGIPRRTFYRRLREHGIQ